MKNSTFAVFIIAYNAFDTIIEVYERIPAVVKKKAKEIFVIDDCSQDTTFEKILTYKQKKKLEKLTLFRNPINLGYGGNQKKGYDYAIKQGYDLVIMLHADAQCAPEKIIDLIKPFSDSDAQLGMVFGSRMTGNPLKGGMPVIKYIGNKILTLIQNSFLGTHLSEFHSGYRCYSTKVLTKIPYHLCSDGFSFDTEVIIMLLQRGYKIAEADIPTHYGKEVCHVPLISYGLHCLMAVFQYKLSQIGLAYFERYTIISGADHKTSYDIKRNSFSSHSMINQIIANDIAASKYKLSLLDLGCGNGTIFKENANKVKIVGIDENPDTKLDYYSEVISSSIDEFSQIREIGLVKFDIIVAADILEHCANPEAILIFYTNFLKPNGKIIISVPNVANVFIRFLLLFGIFNYTDKGILDRTHLRFFTKKSITTLIKKVGFKIDRILFSIIPFELVLPGLIYFKRESVLRKITYSLTRLRPTLFAYQFIIVANKKFSA